MLGAEGRDGGWGGLLDRGGIGKPVSRELARAAGLEELGDGAGVLAVEPAEELHVLELGLGSELKIVVEGVGREEGDLVEGETHMRSTGRVAK